MSVPAVRAVVDIGTNSVKILVARVIAGRVEPLHERSEQTRLGRGLYDTNRLSPEAITDTAKVLREYRAEADRLRATSFRVLGTSAARDAENSSELVTAIRESTDVDLEIVSGDREAALVYRGVHSQTDRAGESVLAVDVGGGSTEFILGAGHEPIYATSHQIGTVRMLTGLDLDDPPGDAAMNTCVADLRRLLADRVAPRLMPAVKSLRERPLEIIGPGGTTTFLARIHLETDAFDRARFESTRFTVTTLRELTLRLWRLKHHERQNLRGLPANRADVILLGSAIYLAALEEFEIPVLRVSTRGLRFGVLLED